MLKILEKFILGQTLYNQKQDEMDKKQIIKKISIGANKLNFPFKDIAKEFRIINSNTKSIIIPFGDGKEICDKIRNLGDYEFPDKRTVRKAQRYTVQVHNFIFDYLNPVLQAYCNEQFYILGNYDIYKDDIGLTFEDITYYEKDNLII